MSSYRAAGSELESLEIFAKLKEEKHLKIQRQIRIRRPSAATSKTSIFHTGPCIFGCISGCFLYRPPPPPRFQAKATRPKRHLTHASSLIVCEVSFLWVFWHIRGAGVVGEGW